MFQTGRICVKTAGRDSNKICVIVDVIDEKYVLIDGQTRRKKVNVLHLEPLSKTVDIKKKAKTEDVIAALESAGFKVEKKGDAKKAAPRPRKVKVVKKQITEAKPAKEAKAAKPQKA